MFQDGRDGLVQTVCCLHRFQPFDQAFRHIIGRKEEAFVLYIQSLMQSGQLPRFGLGGLLFADSCGHGFFQGLFQIPSLSTDGCNGPIQSRQFFIAGVITFFFRLQAACSLVVLRPGCPISLVRLLAGLGQAWPFLEEGRFPFGSVFRIGSFLIQGHLSRLAQSFHVGHQLGGRLASSFDLSFQAAPVLIGPVETALETAPFVGQDLIIPAICDGSCILYFSPVQLLPELAATGLDAAVLT